MLLKAHAIAERLDKTKGDPKDPLEIIPRPDMEVLRNSGAASVDLRLGRWFLILRESRITVLDISKATEPEDSTPIYARSKFVPFGESLILHPGKFVLGSTLEWLRMPANLSGFITGKSSWGRRGLIIETAAAIHPGFSACLTLEITNLGEIPIAIAPGYSVCQISIYETTDSNLTDKSNFIGFRRPVIRSIQPDRIARQLSKPISTRMQ